MSSSKEMKFQMPDIMDNFNKSEKSELDDKVLENKTILKSGSTNDRYNYHKQNSVTGLMSNMLKN